MARRSRNTTRTLVALLWSLMACGVAQAAERMPSAMLIRVGPGTWPEVVSIYSPVSATHASSDRGLLVWTDRGRDSYRFLDSAGAAAGVMNRLSTSARVSDAPRQSAGPIGSFVSLSTVQLEQIVTPGIVRGGGFLTPCNSGYHLDPRITIRRRPSSNGPAFPAVDIELRQGATVLHQFHMRAGQRKITWSEIENLPLPLTDGLPPGQYTLRTTQGDVSTTFFVEEPEIADWVMETPGGLAALLGTVDSPLCVQVTCTHLVAQLDENGRPRPYLADALDLLEEVPSRVITPFLDDFRCEVIARLQGAAPAGRDRSDNGTGVPAIDEARRDISAGRWAAADNALRKAETTGSRRARSLAILYRAVLLAESGRTTESQATALFEKAILMAEDPSDLYRAHNNYANFLLGRAQDRLYNHAFHIATGEPLPLIRALVAWRDALVHFEAAERIARRLGPDDQAAVMVNLARSYALLADVIRTLDPPVHGARRFEEGERSASVAASQLARTALTMDAGSMDAMTRAGAYDVLACLAFRAGDSGRSAECAAKALHAHLEAGALAGTEGAHRLLGILHLREADEAHDGVAAQESRHRAIEHLRIACFLGEFLRDQLPPDRIGLGRAGFFARRAYVYEQLAAMEMAEGRHTEALRCVELAKARSLQDVLCGGGASSRNAAAPRTISEILNSWPEETAALVYWVGSRRVWLFAVDVSGEVTSYELEDGAGRPIASQEFVARVRSFLNGMEDVAGQMRRRLAENRGFDPSWQDELHEFYRQLVPAPLIQQLRKAKTVLVVPHHILHYFPFAALVTRPDLVQRDAWDVPKPAFLLDEPFDLCRAPSLTAWDLLRERPDRRLEQVNAIGIAQFSQAASLPGVEKDLQNLRATFRGALGEVVVGRAASERRVMDLLRHEGLVFVATHGMNYADDPLKSFLRVGVDRESDGYLTARELFSCPVGADLVVMSACYSGLADRSPLAGDDLFGLQRALLCGGARTVVSGLWDVYDGTGPEIMAAFFRELADAKPVPRALANAQRSLLAEMRSSPNVEPWVHPYFWAVYTAIGDDRTAFPPQQAQLSGGRSGVTGFARFLRFPTLDNDVNRASQSNQSREQLRCNDQRP